MEDHIFQDRDKLVKDLIKILERGSPNDVRIKLSDGEIFANKDILMARSDYFATMFRNNNFIEGENSSVDMSHCSYAVMEKIVKFLFSGEAKFGNLSLSQLVELCHMSDMMILEKMSAEAKDYIKDVINYKSMEKDFTEIISGLQTADQYLPEVKWWIILTLHFNMLKYTQVGDVNGSDSFKTLPFNLIKDVFLLLRLKKVKGKAGASLSPPTAMQKFKAFVLWLSKNEATEKQKSEIVESINFKEFSVEELMTSVRDSGLYPAKRIDERVLDLSKAKDNLLEEKDILLKAKDKLINSKEREIQILKYC